MKERPILFSGPMVRAILDGRKTQTRRVVKCDGLDLCGPCGNSVTGDARFCGRDHSGNSVLLKCPFGETGDRLWVRETWGLCSPHDPTDWCGGSIKGVSVSELQEQFLVEHRQNWITHPESAYWRPSIFMPRWASRITLEIAGVRVEPLQEISEEDAKAEGAPEQRHPHGGSTLPSSYHWHGFRELWTSIHSPASWDANPWVWVIAFRRLDLVGPNSRTIPAGT